jgi:hypothetical protein
MPFLESLLLNYMLAQSREVRGASTRPAGPSLSLAEISGDRFSLTPKDLQIHAKHVGRTFFADPKHSL